MSFSDPVRIIDHIPKDFNMKIKQRHRGQLKPAPKPKAQPAKAPEPFSCERPRRVWTLIAFFGALAIILGALVTGAWNENPN